MFIITSLIILSANGTCGQLARFIASRFAFIPGIVSSIHIIYALLNVGECRLTCLQGDDLPLPRDATTVQQCGPHEFCSLEQYITPNGFIRHKATCKDSSVCGGSTVVGTYMVVCSECCDTTLCSASGCNSPGYNSTRGHICYHCPYPVDDPKQCDKIRVCSYDQVCGIHHTPYGQYKLGCESKSACATIQNLGICATCCMSDLCNTQCTVLAGATTTQAATCVDSRDCQTISSALAVGGRDICTDVNLNHYCNYTCGLCPGQTTKGNTVSSPIPSTTTVAQTIATTGPHPCTPNPCVHGSCIPISNGYVCSCDPGYTGAKCDKVDNPCSPNPCVHGTCAQTGQTYMCSCNSGYSGSTCSVQDPCSPNPCVHGTCTKSGSSFTCSCNSGYTGPTCAQVHSSCMPNPCVHGVCSSAGTSFTCRCNTGYMGQTCNTRDPCASVPCIHGNCSSTVSGGYHCHCDPGYTGIACDTDIDECQSNPCVHGFCQDNINGYSCSCLPGYTGKSCQTDIDECQSSPCVNGLCHNDVNGYTCTCFPGFTGRQCSIDIDNCAPINPCQHGVCHDQMNGFTCTCAKGYTGASCDKVSRLRDCKDVLDFGHGTRDGIYTVDLGGSKIDVLCDLTTSGGGWTVLMNRKDAHVDFLNKDSSDYAMGFGHKNGGNFWEGLETMHSLTADGRRYQLRVDLEAANRTHYYAIYDDFSVGPAKDFTLHVGKYRGTAGDSLSGHSGYGFTTYDRDVDTNPGTNCAIYLSGAWWFHDCYDSCLTCPYVVAASGTMECSSMSWHSVRYCEPLRGAKLMVRPM